MIFGSNWKKHIQINIYDRSLQELDDNGVDLENLLKEIGCSKVWISEGKHYTNDSDSDVDSSFDNTIPLSSTIANHIKLPRFSTPVHSQHVERKFTFNATRAISRISPEDDGIDQIADDYDNEEVGNIVSEMVEMVAISRENVTAATSNCQEMLRKPKIEPGACRSLVVTKKKVENRKRTSEPEIRINLPLLSTKCSRPVLKRSASTIKRKNKKVIRISAIKSVHPLSIETQINEKEYYKPNQEVSVQRAESSEKVYMDLTPFSSDADSRETHGLQQLLNLSVFAPIEEPGHFDQNQEDGSGGCYYSDDEYLETDETLNIRERDDISNYVENFQNDEEMPEQEEEEDVDVEGAERPDEYIVENEPSTSRPCLVKNNKDASKSNKKVSFSIQSNTSRAASKRAQQKRMRNKIHTIECNFQGCGHVYKWRVKYGKLRLVDHALTHTTKKYLKCKICDVRCATSRQIRHHYSKCHEAEKVEGYGMKDIPVGDVDIKNIWRECYKDQLDIVGEATSRDKHTRIRRVKREENDENTTLNESELSRGAEEAPHARSDFFQFSRIH